MTDKTKHKTPIDMAIEMNLQQGRSHGRFNLEKLRALKLLGTRYVSNSSGPFPYLEHALGNLVGVDESIAKLATSAQIELCWSGFRYLESNPTTLSICKEEVGKDFAIFGLGTLAIRQDVLALVGLVPCGNHSHFKLSDGELMLLTAVATMLIQEFNNQDENILVDLDKSSHPLDAAAFGCLFDISIVRPVEAAVYEQVAKDKALELLAATKYVQSIGSPINLGTEVVDAAAASPDTFH